MYMSFAEGRREGVACSAAGTIYILRPSRARVSKGIYIRTCGRKLLLIVARPPTSRHARGKLSFCFNMRGEFRLAFHGSFLRRQTVVRAYSESMGR